MRNIMIKLLGDKRGASAAEYALILAVIGAGIVVAMTALGGSIGDAVQQASDDISGSST